MATIKDVLGVEKIYETIKSANCLLSKLEDNPGWQDTFEHEIDEFKQTHSNAECIALQVALSSHVFLFCRDEFFTLPISDEVLARRIGTCDSNQKFSRAKVVSPFSSLF